MVNSKSNERLGTSIRDVILGEQPACSCITIPYITKFFSFPEKKTKPIICFTNECVLFSSGVGHII